MRKRWISLLAAAVSVLSTFATEYIQHLLGKL